MPEQDDEQEANRLDEQYTKQQLMQIILDFARRGFYPSRKFDVHKDSIAAFRLEIDRIRDFRHKMITISKLKGKLKLYGAMAAAAISWVCGQIDLSAFPKNWIRCIDDADDALEDIYRRHFRGSAGRTSFGAMDLLQSFGSCVVLSFLQSEDMRKKKLPPLLASIRRMLTNKTLIKTGGDDAIPPEARKPPPSHYDPPASSTTATATSSSSSATTAKDPFNPSHSDPHHPDYRKKPEWSSHCDPKKSDRVRVEQCDVPPEPVERDHEDDGIDDQEQQQQQHGHHDGEDDDAMTDEELYPYASDEMREK